VADDGPGIPDEVQAKIFDPFFTTKAVGKGTGLGLTVAYAIAKEHGGGISVATVPGGGASFILELPAGGTHVRTAEAASTAPVGEVPVGTRALVVEDEQALGDAVADAMRDAGFEVDRAGDGEEAIIRTQERAYDVIVCDLKMPRVDGMAFFDHLSATAPALTRRIIFVTGDVAGTEAEAFLARSKCRWLAKPFRLRDIVRTAREVIA
jgi:CheY-like chemotaxis protein